MNNWPKNKWIKVNAYGDYWDAIIYLCGGPSNDGGFIMKERIRIKFNNNSNWKKVIEDLDISIYTMNSGKRDVSKFSEFNLSKYAPEIKHGLLYYIFTKF